MPQKMEKGLKASFRKKKRQGKLKGVSQGQYVYGSKAMQKYLRQKRGQ